LGTGLSAPEPPPAIFQPDRFLDWFCRVLSGKQVRCAAASFEPDGELCFELGSRGRSVRLRLGPKSEEKRSDLLPLAFGTLRPASSEEARKPWLAFARYASARLEQVRERYHVPLLDLFVLDRPDEVFVFEPGLFRWRIAPFLIAGQTRHGPYRYAGEQFEDHALHYRFESASGSLVLRLEIGAGRPGAAVTTRHLSLTLAIDERTGEQRQLPEHRVEGYLGFLLALCDPPSARYAERARTEAIVAGSTQDWGADLELQFFADPGHDFLTNHYAVFGLSWPVAFVFHGERECSNMGTFTPVPMRSFVEHPMHIRPRRRLAERVYLSDLRELDTVLGGEERLRQALIEASRQPEIRTLVVQDTCLVRVIGDDVRRVIEELREVVPVPIVYLDATAMDDAAPFEPMVQFWRDLLCVTAAEHVAPDPTAVNLVGYGLSDDPHMRELERLLGQVGVRLNAALFPGLDHEPARRFRAAAVNLVNPWHYVRSSFEGVRAWADLPTLSPGLPFGREGTRRWLDAVRRAVAPGASAEPLPDFSPSELERWRELERQAGELSVALVLVSTQAARLLESDRWLGAPLGALLGELGFRVRVLCFDPEAVRGRSERVEPAELGRALERSGLADRLELVVFDDRRQLPDLLRASQNELVYSEIRDDPRVRDAAKEQFSLVDLELGLSGALRTAERLVRRARGAFRQRYARHLTGSKPA
jgi:hypothetical protein